MATWIQTPPCRCLRLDPLSGASVLVAKIHQAKHDGMLCSEQFVVYRSVFLVYRKAAFKAFKDFLQTSWNTVSNHWRNNWEKLQANVLGSRVNLWTSYGGTRPGWYQRLVIFWEGYIHCQLWLPPRTMLHSQEIIRWVGIYKSTNSLLHSLKLTNRPWKYAEPQKERNLPTMLVSGMLSLHRILQLRYWP